MAFAARRAALDERRSSTNSPSPSLRDTSPPRRRFAAGARQVCVIRKGAKMGMQKRRSNERRIRLYVNPRTENGETIEQRGSSRGRFPRRGKCPRSGQKGGGPKPASCSTHRQQMPALAGHLPSAARFFVKIRFHEKYGGQHKKTKLERASSFCVGTDLSFQSVTRQVFSAQVSLTSVFGMGTGGPSPLIAPTIQDTLYPEN